MRVFIETSLAADDRRYLTVHTDKDGRQYVRTGKGARVRKYLDQMRRTEAVGIVVYSDAC